MGEIRLIDTSLRDGNQSLWGATGVNTEDMKSMAPTLDAAGFKAIDFTSSAHMGVYVRYHKEDPWEAIRQGVKAMPNTPLSLGTSGRRFIGFKRLPDSMLNLVVERAAANGIRRIWLVDASHDATLIHKVARMCKAAGIEEMVCALCFTISPVHTDEYYGKIAAGVVSSPDVDGLYLKDQGGLLTPERVRTLVPALLKASGGKPLELHPHCNTGLGTACALEAIRLGVDTIHTAIPPLAYGTSLPSALNLLDNLPHMDYAASADRRMVQLLPSWAQGKEKTYSRIDRSCLEQISEKLSGIAHSRNYPIGAPVEHSVYYYQHQIPGGMMTTLKRQLMEMKQEMRLSEVVDEVVRVREELGYPVMVTPLSQFVAAQATMNVINRQRYKVVPEGVLQYAAGWFGQPPVPIKADVMEKITASPRAREVFSREFPELTTKEIRESMGIGSSVPDEEFILRYVMIDKEIDEMLAAKGKTAGH